MREKGFVQIIIVILLLVLVGGVAYYFGTMKGNVIPTPTQIPTQITPTTKPTTDPTANWKTFSSAVIGVTIKYPATWTYIDKQKYIGFETSIPSLEKREGTIINYALEISQEDSSNYSQWSQDSNTTKLVSVNINNMSFERDIVPDMYYSLNYIYKSDNGKIIRFMLYPYTKDEQPTVLDSTINQILSTFKFTQ